MLLRLLRGSGRAGLAGIAAHRGRLLRPLLAATRTDVRRFLVEQGLTATLDRSNADLSHRRNRVRRLLVPLLESEFNPRLGQTLAATAERLRDEDVVLGEIAARCLAELGKDGALSTAVGAEPRAIVRRVVRAWLQPPAARALSAHDIERVVALATPGGPRRVDLARGDTILTDGIWLRVEPTVAVPRRR